jgi:DNA repair protein RadD
VLSREDIERFFFETDVIISANGRLRTPQIQGHEAAREYFASGGHRAIEQIPVGCGKTGLISVLPFRVAGHYEGWRKKAGASAFHSVYA